MGQHRGVLIVDDNLEILEAMSSVMAAFGVLAMTARNAEQALRVLREGELPALILCDVRMPEMDGHAFVQALQKEPEPLCSAAVVLMSTDERQEARAASLGVEFFHKPSDISALMDLVARYVPVPGFPTTPRSS